MDQQKSGLKNSVAYEDVINRNIGFLTHEEQEKLRNSCVAVFGMGGLGGAASEVLCRSGIGHIKIIEPAHFEPTNLNRQIFCFCSTLNKKKAEVAAKFLNDINPHVKVDIYDKEEKNNIGDILKGVDVAILAVDKSRACIIISRKTREMGIPLVESWAFPYLITRVYTRGTISMEEVYGLSTIGKDAEMLDKDELKKADVQMINRAISDVEGLDSYVNDTVAQRIAKGENTTFAPCVWLNSVMMALEAMKILLGWGNVPLAPKFAVYDPFLHRLPKTR